jgi:hypothetical protein
MRNNGIRYAAFLLLFVLAGVAAIAEDQVVGIVSRFQGKLMHRLGGKITELQRMDYISRDSRIELAEGSKRGLVEILTATGPVRYSRFPVTGFLRLTGLSDVMQDQYRTALGGKVLVTRGAFKLRSRADLFDWSMEVGTLDGRDLGQDLYLVLSTTQDSRAIGTFAPLYFKLKDGLEITDARFIIEDQSLGFVEKEGEYEKRGDQWIYRFDNFEYESNVSYVVKNLFSLSDGSQAQWNFTYRIFSREDMEFVEQEVKDSLDGELNDFQKAMVRAAVYQTYKLKLSSIKTLKAEGVDVDGMLTEE